MNDSTENIDLIERYFDDEMTEQEKIAFHERMKSDLALKHEFDREKLLVNTIRFSAAKGHLAFLKDLEKSLPEITAEKGSSRMIYYAAAACILVVLMVGTYIFRSGQPQPAELFAENFKPYPNVFEPTVRGNNIATNRALAFQKYEEGAYAEAAGMFSEILKDQREPGILLLLGNANLSLGKTDLAKANFTEVIQSGDNLKYPALWYLSLCYVKEGNTKLAIETLSELSNGNVAYAKKAQELLHKLQR